MSNSINYIICPLKMNNYNLFISMSIILLFKSCINYVKWDAPNNLSIINPLYKGTRIPEPVQPIIAYDKVFFLDHGATKVLYYNTGRIFSLYPNLYRRPLLYTNTYFAYSSLFVTKDFNIYLYKERAENTFENSNFLWLREIRELGSSYDSLRIYYDYDTSYAAIYNYYQSTKIIVINLKNNKKIVDVCSKNLVIQALIYSGIGKSLLIAIDTGIRFYNIEGYKTSWGFNDKGALVSCLEDSRSGVADFIDGNKLLFAYSYSYSYSHYLIVFELEDIKIPYEKYNFYEYFKGEKINCILGLKDGNALIGTDNGYIYLIGYVFVGINKKLKILDYRKICKNAVYSLSYTNNCLQYSKDCYIFAANCGYIYVFEISNKKRENLMNNLSKEDQKLLLNIIVIFIIFIVICYCIDKCKKKEC